LGKRGKSWGKEKGRVSPRVRPENRSVRQVQKEKEVKRAVGPN